MNRLTERAKLLLLNRIQQHYEVVHQQFCFGSLTLDFIRVKDSNVVLDRLADEATAQNQPRLPYWAELWESSFAVADHLAQSHKTLVGQHVLDLGCGMGLTGTVAAGLGGEIIFADIEPHALLFARLNSLPFEPRVEVRRLDWQTDQLAQRLDLIIGADVLYEREQWPHLNAFWRLHLANGGRVLLGEPGRQTGDEFPKWVQDRGWALTTSQQPVTGRPKPIRLFHLTL